jgi:hypothetical protein
MSSAPLLRRRSVRYGDEGKPRGIVAYPRTPGAETAVSGYPDCSGRRVELWRIAGGDHASGLSRYSLKAILDFIAADRTAATPQ